MSFALQYRKQLQAKQRQDMAFKKANEGFVSLPAEASTDTSNNRRRVFMALVLAGGILAVFNSGGLVNYTQEMASNPIGPKLILASEKWHELMQEKQVTRVVDHIRGSVAFVRNASWQDLTFGLELTTAEKSKEAQPSQQVIPAKLLETPKQKESIKPRMARPDGPIMRASIDKLP